ncbi:MAG: hypothetical protein JOY96_01585 [Verrucomicrobia bacterium]|nr:hypothetical protein [Verrucomicrobiota bacterium]
MKDLQCIGKRRRAPAKLLSDNCSLDCLAPFLLTLGVYGSRVTSPLNAAICPTPQLTGAPWEQVTVFGEL